MKKILSFTDYYWPGYKAGGTIRAFMNQVDYLKDRYEFFIVTRNTDYTETAPYPDVVPDCWTHPEPHVHIYYVSAARQKPGTFFRLLRETAHDVLYIHLLFGLYYSLLPLIFARLLRKKKIIIAAHGVLGRGALGVKPGRKKLFFRIMRWIGFYRGVFFHSVTDHETRDILTHIGPKTRILEARELPRRVTQPPVRSSKPAGTLRMVTIARISPEKNQLYALEVLSGFTTHPVQYDLIGPVHDQAYWDRCRTVIDSMPGNIRVNYRGSVSSELILSELQQYDVMFLPTTGENFGHTILESFMAGCPVLISDQTPWRNLAQAGIGYDLPLDDREGFRKAIAWFAAADAVEFGQISDKAYIFAHDYCSSPAMLEENIQLFNQ